MKNFFSERGDALAQAAQGGGGVITPGGVQEPWRRSSDGCGGDVLIVGL